MLYSVGQTITNDGHGVAFLKLKGSRISMADWHTYCFRNFPIGADVGHIATLFEIKDDGCLGSCDTLGCENLLFFGVQQAQCEPIETLPKISFVSIPNRDRINLGGFAKIDLPPCVFLPFNRVSLTTRAETGILITIDGALGTGIVRSCRLAGFSGAGDVLRTLHYLDFSEGQRAAFTRELNPDKASFLLSRSQGT